MKRTPIRRASTKQRAKLATYSRLRVEFLRSHPKCEACATLGNVPRASCDVHHVYGRGKFLCDVATFLAVCRACHDAIHSAPNRARQQGFLARK